MQSNQVHQLGHATFIAHSTHHRVAGNSGAAIEYRYNYDRNKEDQPYKPSTLESQVSYLSAARARKVNISTAVPSTTVKMESIVVPEFSQAIPQYPCWLHAYLNILKSWSKILSPSEQEIPSQTSRQWHSQPAGECDAKPWRLHECVCRHVSSWTSAWTIMLLSGTMNSSRQNCYIFPLETLCPVVTEMTINKPNLTSSSYANSRSLWHPQTPGFASFQLTHQHFCPHSCKLTGVGWRWPESFKGVMSTVVELSSSLWLWWCIG